MPDPSLSIPRFTRAALPCAAARLFAAALVSAAALSAQCPRPPVPQGGLATTVLPTEQVTYSDGVIAPGQLLLPIDPPPSCGWPLIVHVHRLGADRGQDFAWHQEVAAQGYAIWSYDLRGQGETRSLNPTAGTTLYGAVERFDLAEQIAHVRGSRPLEISQDKVAVIGGSQGGIHGWMAAAQSGQALSVASRGTIGFPTITAVAGSDFVVEPTDARVRGGTLFNAYFMALVLADPTTAPFLLDSGFADSVKAFFAAQDPAGLRAFLLADPGRAVTGQIEQSAVPVLFHQAWHDSLCGPGPILDRAADMAPGTPLRLTLSTVGHSVPTNQYERRMKRELTLRWLERYLWEEANGVDSEAALLLARMPLDPARYEDSDSLWVHLHEDALPAADTAPLRLYTDGQGGLAETAPTGRSSSGISHQVAPGFDAQAYLSTPGLRTIDEVLNQVPLSEQLFSYTLPEDREMVGAPRLHLRLLPDAEGFTIAALLLARLPSETGFRLLSHWGRGVLDAVPGSELDLEFELGPIAVELPAGTELRLSLRNHWLTAPPHFPMLVTVPLFDSSNLSVIHDADPDHSWIELPLRHKARAGLLCDSHSLPFLQPGRTTFEVEAGSRRAGDKYLLAASTGGHSPGIPLPGGELPLVQNAITDLFVLSLGKPELIDFLGDLDADGRGTAVLDLSAFPSMPPSMFGQRMSFAAWIFEAMDRPWGEPTNPVDLIIR